MSAANGKNAKNPLKTGMRCIICQSWEVKIPPKSSHGKATLLIEHETFCPDYRS